MVLVWFDVVWCGSDVVWKLRGMVWYGAWRGLVRSDVQEKTFLLFSSLEKMVFIQFSEKNACI